MVWFLTITRSFDSWCLGLKTLLCHTHLVWMLGLWVWWVVLCLVSFCCCWNNRWGYEFIALESENAVVRWLRGWDERAKWDIEEKLKISIHGMKQMCEWRQSRFHRYLGWIQVFPVQPQVSTEAGSGMMGLECRVNITTCRDWSAAVRVLQPSVNYGIIGSFGSCVLLYYCSCAPCKTS